jgi:hypothetical protein
MEVKGKMIHCTRCDNTTFLKYIRTEDRDGGFSSSYDVYEKLPEEWLYETEFGYLCPICAAKFKSFMTEFLGDKTIVKWRLPKTED